MKYVFSYLCTDGNIWNHDTLYSRKYTMASKTLRKAIVREAPSDAAFVVVAYYAGSGRAVLMSHNFTEEELCEIRGR